MVIICPECSTKFRVNPERIPASGAKVRCARCKHIFLATKPVHEEELKPIISMPETSPEEPEEETQPVRSEPPVEEADESTEKPFSILESAPEKEEEVFSYDQFRELDNKSPEREDFTFGGEEETEQEADFETKDVEPEEEEASFSFGTAEEVEHAQQEIESEGTEHAVKKPQLTAEEKIASIFAEEEPKQEAKPERSAAVAKSSPSSSIIRVLLLLILGLVIIGAALYFINGPEQIEQAIEQILGQYVRPAESGQIALDNLEGKFINNQDAGELFVIRGEATNKYKEPRAAIQVKGVIFDQNGKPLLQKTIFCGNPINDQELQTLPFSKLEEMMRNQFGKSLENMKVNSKESIPFVIAFRDLPQNLSEFTVDVTSSEPATK
ncbi:DUF3426 domain-containing protein [Malonomonas rubra]|uniref:DUF3426 domain-containing protein n=1 Tax=Malonomonas rubra TaxID=57040 RepID=UPI0026F19BFA|nr:DUF3426 domain-containing protein [Malonomonas rubra]